MVGVSLLAFCLCVSVWLALTLEAGTVNPMTTTQTTRAVDATVTTAVATNVQAKDPYTTTTANAFPLVECAVTTPFAPHDTEQAANGVIQITLRTDVAPVASQYFVDLVQAGWYRDNYVFRVVRNFVAQWGAQARNVPRQAPPVPTNAADTNNTLSNRRGTLSFTGGRPKSKQVFINLKDNTRLDKEGSRPFAEVSAASMARVVDRLYMGYHDGEGQIPALRQGIILEKFPKMSQIVDCRIVESFTNVS